MDLSAPEAMQACQQVIDQAVKFGGVLTVNWHTRSLSPERLWGDFYLSLLQEMKKYRVWFGTAKQAIDWFCMRRSIRFEQVEGNAGSLSVKVDQSVGSNPAPFVIRTYRTLEKSDGGLKSEAAEQPYSDISWNGDVDVFVDVNSRTAECDTI
jgi:hypothetical protein